MTDSPDITIEGSEAVWVMPRTDGELGGTYTGVFRFRCFLDPLKELQAGREYRELLGTFATQATDTESKLAWALSQLKHRIIKAPPFWTSTLQDSGYAGNIGDMGILTLVTDAAFRAEVLFKAKIQKEHNEALELAIKISEEKLKQATKVE